MFFEIGVLRNFAIFTEKHLCWSLFLIKLLAFQATLLKRDSNTGIFQWTLQNTLKHLYLPPVGASGKIYLKLGFNPFNATDHFQYPLKTPENQRFAGGIENSWMKSVKKACTNMKKRSCKRQEKCVFKGKRSFKESAIIFLIDINQLFNTVYAEIFWSW